MAYTVYSKKRSHAIPPAVTITSAGRIGLDAALARMFRNSGVESVLILFDVEKRKVALSPVAKDDKRSYSLAYATDLTQASLSAHAFLKEIGWDRKLYRIPAQWDEKNSLLEFNVPGWGEKQAIVSVTAGREKAG